MKQTLALITALILVLPFSADASRIERGDIVTVTEQELVAENLYMVGGQVTFSSVAQKDFVAAGGKVLQNGTVWGDVLVAGGTVDVIDDVRGDVRVVGGQVTIQGMVGGDVTVAGGMVTILPGTVIAGDLIAAGGAVLMQGTVNGQSKLYGGTVAVNGLLAGPAVIMAQDSVTFGEKTVIGSTLHYRSPEEAEVVSGAELGDKITFTALDLPRVDEGTLAAILFGIVTVLFIAKLLALALTSALMVTYFGPLSRSITEMAIGRFWQMLLAGLGAVIVTPVVGALLVVTVLGMYLGFMLFALYGLVLLLSVVASCIIAGGVVSKLTVKSVHVSWKWAVLGTVILSLVTLVPLVGWLVVLVLYLVSVGSVAQHLYNAAHTRMS